MSHTEDLERLRAAVAGIARQLPADFAHNDALYDLAFAAAERLHVEARNRGELRAALLRWANLCPQCGHEQDHGRSEARGVIVCARCPACLRERPYGAREDGSVDPASYDAPAGAGDELEAYRG